MKFGTSGLRGLATDLVGDVTTRHVVAFCQHMQERGAVATGDPIFLSRDLRDSSPVIRDDCAAAIRATGLEAIDCGTLPTPALALHAMTHRAPAIMITGSHIPADRNGIKFYRPDGEIDKADEAEITRRAGGHTIDTVPLHGDTLISQEPEAQASYLERCQSILPQSRLSGLRIGIYEHSSIARDLFSEILRYLGAVTVSLGRSDAFVAVDTEAVSADTQKQLSAWSREHELDAILSTDGDADRPLLADETGAVLRGDLLGLAAAMFTNADVVVTPVSSNSAIDERYGFETLRTRIGSPYVIEAMKARQESGTVVGFEANGGFLLQTAADTRYGRLPALPTRDCVLPILATLEAAVENDEPLSALRRRWQFAAAAADRLENYPTVQARNMVDHLQSSVQNASAFLTGIAAVERIDTLDGARMTLSDGRIIHYRPSGNAPELRCYVEASSETEAQALLAEGLARAEAFRTAS